MLLRALAVARIATLAAGGSSTERITQVLVASGVCLDTSDVGDLTERVVRWFESDGITGSFQLRGFGLQAWSPESTYRLLLELWSARRLGSASASQIKRELRHCWGVDQAEWLDTCLSRPIEPLRDYPDVLRELRAEPDGRVSNVAALTLHGSASNQAWERWADRLPFDVLQAEHLLDVGGDLIRGTMALSSLSRQDESPNSGLSGRAARALEIIEDQIRRMETAVGGLTTRERDLVRERSDEVRFQDGCIESLVAWSCGRQYPSSWAADPGVAHGMWGPLPWWTMTLDGEDQMRAADAALATGTLPLGFGCEPAIPDRVDLLCRTLPTGLSRLRTQLSFDLTNPAHVGELLLIGRRGEICVEVLGRRCVEPDEPELVRMGVLNVAVQPETAQPMIEMACRSLRALLPPNCELGKDGGGIPLLDAALAGSSARHVDHWPVGRRLLVTGPEPAGQIKLEAEHTRTTKRGSGQPMVMHRGDGFVYVQSNPAIPGMLKVGYGDKLSEDRAQELSNTSVPFPFEVLFRARVSQARKVEQAAHRLLAVHRVAPNREFFCVTQDAAEEAIRYGNELVNGIRAWEPMPATHRLRSGDALVLPLRANQVFVATAYADLLAPVASVVDVWQAHADGDVLELQVDDDPGAFHGLSDGDAAAEEDPLPYLNREETVPNGCLIGRERLTAGDRLSWLSDEVGGGCRHVVFEVEGSCQVTCRTWHPRSGPDGAPLLLNVVTQDLSTAVAAAAPDALELGPPRSWAPRSPGTAGNWTLPATQEAPAEYWLPALRRRRKS